MAYIVARHRARRHRHTRSPTPSLSPESRVYADEFVCECKTRMKYTSGRTIEEKKKKKKEKKPADVLWMLYARLLRRENDLTSSSATPDVIRALLSGTSED